MKKSLYSLYVLVIILNGCSKQVKDQNEEINFENNQEIVDVIEYSHGVTDYNFEQWVYDGTTPLRFDYEIENSGKDVELGLMFLVDGIPQRYKVNEVETEMEIFSMNNNDHKNVKIEMNPEIVSDQKIVNMNPVVILNPREKVKQGQEYGVNHTFGGTATILMDVNKTQRQGTSLKQININSENDVDLSNENTDLFLKDNQNMLDNDVYIQTSDKINQKGTVSTQEGFALTLLGKEGNYRILQFINNKAVAYSDFNVEKDKQTEIEIILEADSGDNLYFVVVPLDVQSPHDYIMINQSNRWVVE